MKKLWSAIISSKKNKIIFIIVCVLAITPFAVSLARFVTEKTKDYYLHSKNFFFNSNRLKVNNPLYIINNWTGVGDFTVEIEMNSLDNNLLKSEYDIAYDINYTCPTEVICSISKTNSVIYKASSNDVFSITITPTREFEDGESVSFNITASSTTPYEKTISADFQIVVGKRGVSYEINDQANRPYLLVSITNALSYYTVREAFGSYSVNDKIDIVAYKNLSATDKAKCSSAIINLTFNPRTVVLDTTSSVLNGATTQSESIGGVNYVNEITFEMNPVSSQEVRFYKIDHTRNYTYPLNNTTPVVAFEAR